MDLHNPKTEPKSSHILNCTQRLWRKQAFNVMRDEVSYSSQYHHSWITGAGADFDTYIHSSEPFGVHVIIYHN
jgi:hypothetical protein